MFEAEGDESQLPEEAGAGLTDEENGPFVLVDEVDCNTPTPSESPQKCVNKNYRLDQTHHQLPNRLVRTYTQDRFSFMTTSSQG